MEEKRLRLIEQIKKEIQTKTEAGISCTRDMAYVKELKYAIELGFQKPEEIIQLKRENTAMQVYALKGVAFGHLFSSKSHQEFYTGALEALQFIASLFDKED